jgi:hypothetical protein
VRRRVYLKRPLVDAFLQALRASLPPETALLPSPPDDYPVRGKRYFTNLGLD